MGTASRCLSVTKRSGDVDQRGSATGAGIREVALRGRERLDLRLANTGSCVHISVAIRPDVIPPSWQHIRTWAWPVARHVIVRNCVREVGMINPNLWACCPMGSWSLVEAMVRKGVPRASLLSIEKTSSSRTLRAVNSAAVDGIRESCVSTSFAWSSLQERFENNNRK